MKTKLFTLMMMFFAASLNVMADGEFELLNLSIQNPVHNDDNTNEGAGAHPKSPVQIPEVYLDGHTLSFDAAIEGCEVRLLDEYENVIFADFIEESQTSLILPSTLTGTFELQIIRGSITFYCEIEL